MIEDAKSVGEEQRTILERERNHIHDGTQAELKKESVTIKVFIQCSARGFLEQERRGCHVS
jgi:hypothetical protein